MSPTLTIEQLKELGRYQDATELAQQQLRMSVRLVALMAVATAIAAGAPATE